MQIPIEVTESHIQAADGHAGEYNKCPVAVCLYEMGFDNVNVDEDLIKVTLNGRPLTFKTPRMVNLFIDDFDCDRPVKPFIDELTTLVLPTISKDDDNG